MKKLLSVLSISFFAFAVAIVPAFAGTSNSSEISLDERNGNIQIVNESYASVKNIVSSTANTGGNHADGSYAGDGGNGGDLEINVDPEIIAAGDGGNGGCSDIGGTIITGDAVTDTKVENDVNSNTIEIDGTVKSDKVEIDFSSAKQDSHDKCDCDSKCDHCKSGRHSMCDKCDYKPCTSCKSDEKSLTSEQENNNIEITNKNKADVVNVVDSVSRTGDNHAKGSYAGNGGNGGDLEMSAESQDPTSGEGGAGGDSGPGGYVKTGAAKTFTDVMTVSNRNVTRISR